MAVHEACGHTSVSPKVPCHLIANVGDSENETVHLAAGAGPQMRCRRASVHNRSRLSQKEEEELEQESPIFRHTPVTLPRSDTVLCPVGLPGEVLGSRETAADLSGLLTVLPWCLCPVLPLLHDDP